MENYLKVIARADVSGNFKDKSYAIKILDIFIHICICI